MRWLSPFMGDDATSDSRTVALRRLVGIFALALLGSTWRLWTRQNSFPQVPWFGAMQHVPRWLDSIALASCVVGLAGAIVARRDRWPSRFLVLFIAGMAGMVLFDQERLQPWAYQFVLVAVVLALSRPAEGVGLLRLLIISFYLHSSITKLDYTFLHTLGQQFLTALVAPLGASADRWSDATRLAAAAVFPVGELFVALGLWLARTRSWALCGAVLLHVLLLWILGSWGLGHKPGVLVWNVYFILQDCVLFAPARLWRHNNSPSGDTRVSAGPLAWLPRMLMVSAALLPLLVTTSWFDMWPSWGLYAPCAQRVQLFVHRSAQHQLPDELLPFVDEPTDASDPWVLVRLDLWALAALDAPIYPQNRFQLGVAQAIVGGSDLAPHVSLVVLGLANRFTGQRDYEVLTGPADLNASGAGYWFNSRPRR